MREIRHMTNEEHERLRAALPPYTACVYSVILKGLYGEAGFSDLDCADIAHAMNSDIAPVKGAISRLHKCGLTYTEVWANDRGKVFEIIHAHAHDAELDYHERCVD